VVKTTSAILTSGDVVAALGLSKIDFYVDQMAIWNIGGTDVTLSCGTGAVVNNVSVVKNDWGTPDSPPSIGFNVPRALAKVFSGVQSSSSDVLATASVTDTAGAKNFVFHLWVVFRPSA